MAMRFIDFDKEKCDSCYKCLRACPTKAIAFHGDERRILSDLCIKCGLCLTKCSHQALTTGSGLAKVKALLSGKDPVHVSIAPSFVAAFFLEAPEKMVTALKLLGFSIIEETAVGADLVMKAYGDHLREGILDRVITTCCPSINYLIEQHHPELTDRMIPVVSPMVAHGRMMKHQNKPTDRVVFIGPCLAKMAEGEAFNQDIDGVMTFMELQTWLDEKGIDLYALEETPFNQGASHYGKGFPVGIPLIEVVRQVEASEPISIMKVNGHDQVMNLLGELQKEAMPGHLFELNMCEGSCLNGPQTPKQQDHRFRREAFMMAYLNSRDIGRPMEGLKILPAKVAPFTLETKFTKASLAYKRVAYDQAVIVLRQMGKYTKQDELNCGACGYRTCREKADAVVLGYSDMTNCLAYLRGKAENFHTVLIENSPNGVCILDEKLYVMDFNPTFEGLFGNGKQSLKGIPISTWLDPEIFEQALIKKTHVRGKRLYVEAIKAHVIMNVVYHDREDMLLIFFTDISEDELKKQAFEKIKKETLLKTQEVIDKQMRVAQEIASLLGETTAETKMSLIGLRDFMLTEDRVL